LYSAWAEYDSLADNPDLMYDTLSTNKCYRLAFLEEQGLQFPEGLPHEDLLFATQAYLAAKKIVVTPHRVYNWYIHQRAVKKSVSSRRHEIRHFVDRLVIHRMLDEVLREHGDGELQLHKDIKFVNHDLRLYMAEYALRDPAYQREFRELAREYLGTLDPRALGRCKRPQAIAAFLILMDDQEGLVAISDYLGARGLLSTDLVEHGGRVYWCDRHLETEEGRRLLDVTSFGLHSLPLAQLRLSAVVTSFTIKGSRVHLCGEVGNPLGRLSSQEEPEAVLEFRSRRRRRKIRVPVTAVCHTSTRIRWEAGFSLVRRVGFGLGDRIWDIRLRLTAEGATVVCPLSSLAVDYRGHGIPVRPMFGLLPANRLEPYVIGPSPTSRGGNLGFRLVPRSLAARAVHAMARRLSAVSSCRPRRTRTPGPA
jgi:CDP-glycerol glycerophosphotransferase